jgi:cysteine desulfurase
MWRSLQERIDGVWLNGDAEHRLAANLSVGFDGVDALDLIAAAPDIAISTGSACTSAAVEPSYVLRALGLSDEKAGASIRVGLGRFTTAAQVDFAVDQLAEAVVRLRQAPSAA